MRQLRALLPSDAAGALQERRGPWLPAEVLPPCEQVMAPGECAHRAFHPRHGRGSPAPNTPPNPKPSRPGRKQGAQEQGEQEPGNQAPSHPEVLMAGITNRSHTCFLSSLDLA